MATLSALGIGLREIAFAMPFSLSISVSLIHPSANAEIFSGYGCGMGDKEPWGLVLPYLHHFYTSITPVTLVEILFIYTGASEQRVRPLEESRSTYHVHFSLSLSLW